MNNSLDNPAYRFWHRHIHHDHSRNTPQDWRDQERAISQYGRGIEETLHFVMQQRPSFAAFEEWLQLAIPAPPPEPVADVFTPEDMDFWHTNGYIVLRNAVPPAQCKAAADAIWAFIDADPADPASWYSDHSGKRGLMLTAFQHPAFAANRHSPRVRRAYEQLYGSTPIFLLIDKASFNPPVTSQYNFAGSDLHWDVSLQMPIPYELQGLLYLTDTQAHDGAFHCVPGFHHKAAEWTARFGSTQDARNAAPQELNPVPVTGNAGDLVIWHQALPHCATPNRGTVPRMVQYIAYKPVATETHEQWI